MPNVDSKWPKIETPKPINREVNEILQSQRICVSTYHC